MDDAERSGLWTRMRFLLEGLGGQQDSAAFVDSCLDMLGDLVGAQLGMLCLRPPGETWSPVAARQRRRSVAVRDLGPERVALLEQALSARRSLVRDGTSRLAGQGTSAVVVTPLRQQTGRRGAEPRSVGVLWLELAGGTEVDASRLEFLDSVAVLLAMTLDQKTRLEAAREDLRAARALDSIDDGPSLDELLARESLGDLRPDVRACVVGDSSVMILGESGTGKTRLAAAIAKASGRVPVVRATLGASDDLNTITSELFGHERGAFSGAVTKRKGLVEYADGGTLILDEVLNLPPHAQQLLLDFTQFGTYRPLGYQGKEPRRAAVRILSVTNGNIRQAIADTRFRQDLFFRLAGMVISMPPLRARRQEIPEIAETFLSRLDPARGWQLGSSARRVLLADEWEWEGNIRQLQALIRRARDRAVAEGLAGGAIEAAHIGLPLPADKPSGLPSRPPAAAGPCSTAVVSGPVEDGWARLQSEKAVLEATERELIDKALVENRGVVAHAARQLGISRTSLLSRMSTLGMDRNAYRR
jgi:DNA-binding NtrC family response regulator